MRWTNDKHLLLSKNMRYIRTVILRQSEEELAYGIGVSKSAISAVECGARRPSRELYMAFVGYLHVTNDRRGGFTEQEQELLRKAFTIHMRE